MALGYKRAVDDAMEGRGWGNSRLAEEINRAYKLVADDLVSAEEVYEWRRAENEPRAGFTLAALTVLNLLHLSPFKLGFRRRLKVSPR